MIGVILIPGPYPDMHGLDAERTLSLLPLGDRPLLQHVLESLVAQQITHIEMLVGHAPQQVEAWFGNGSRWGCSIRYHLILQPDRPYKSLKIIGQIKTEPWLVTHGARFPCVRFPAGPLAQPLLYGLQSDLSATGSFADSSREWTGTAVLPPGFAVEKLANCTPNEFAQHLRGLSECGAADVIECADWIDGSTPAALLKTQARLLNNSLDGLMLSGNENAPGIRISRNVVIHDTVELIAPLYIGPNCRINRGVKLGPNLVLGGDCVVDTHTTMENSLVTSGNYIGEGLELENAIVDHNKFVNVRIETGIHISEGFLLGKLQQPLQFEWLGKLVRCAMALVLIVLFLPLILLSFLYFSIAKRTRCSSLAMVKIPQVTNSAPMREYSLLSFGSDAWLTHRQAGWDAFLRQFLPGLFAVARGRLQFVGLAPRSRAEIERMPPEWRAMYLKSKAGLVTEAASASIDAEDDTQLYLVEAYYNARRSFIYDLRLVYRYFIRLIVPVNTAQPKAQTNLVDS